MSTHKSVLYAELVEYIFRNDMQLGEQWQQDSKLFLAGTECHEKVFRKACGHDASNQCQRSRSACSACVTGTHSYLRCMAPRPFIVTAASGLSPPSGPSLQVVLSDAVVQVIALPVIIIIMVVSVVGVVPVIFTSSIWMDGMGWRERERTDVWEGLAPVHVAA
ncbi:hypothetical protein JVT61DRAFT_3637 [Boletus reticuloceps]|uniref:Uncharacterized protein n=1 Tax=Boletus reticuloceps TaxID=495285 RepID=A0A8I2YMT0_9AGAM|nr:hypothetical protein JVT61DRAFT_3637 [Boletus reticuloceps]